MCSAQTRTWHKVVQPQITIPNPATNGPVGGVSHQNNDTRDTVERRASDGNPEIALPGVPQHILDFFWPRTFHKLGFHAADVTRTSVSESTGQVCNGPKNAKSEPANISGQKASLIHSNGTNPSRRKYMFSQGRWPINSLCENHLHRG